MEHSMAEAPAALGEAMSALREFLLDGPKPAKDCKAFLRDAGVKARTLDRANGPRSPKDLRDTFASQLLTVGVQLGYISTQIGHADVAVTARHYARWAGGDAYRSTLAVEAGEVPADLLARLARVTTKVPTVGTVGA